MNMDTLHIINQLREYVPTGRMGRLMNDAADLLEKQQAIIEELTWALHAAHKED